MKTLSRIAGICSVLGWLAAPARAVVQGDMDGNAKPDFVLFNPVNRTTEYDFMNGTVRVGKQAGRTLLAGLKLVAIADVNGDGIMDYIMVNTNRNLVFGVRGANGLITTKLGPILLPGYNIVAVADLNHDHHPDVILFNPVTRMIKVLLMQGVIPSSAAVYPIRYVDAPGPVDWGYKPVAVMDIDGDGAPDIVLSCPGSGTVVWFMNGTYGTGLKGVAVAPGGVDGFDVIGVNDFNFDGSVDLVLLKNPGGGRPLQTQFRLLRLTLDTVTDPARTRYVFTQIGSPVSGPTVPASWTVVEP